MKTKPTKANNKSSPTCRTIPTKRQIAAFHNQLMWPVYFWQDTKQINCNITNIDHAKQKIQHADTDHGFGQMHGVCDEHNGSDCKWDRLITNLSKYKQGRTSLSPSLLQVSSRLTTHHVFPKNRPVECYG